MYSHLVDYFPEYEGEHFPCSHFWEVRNTLCFETFDCIRGPAVGWSDYLFFFGKINKRFMWDNRGLKTKSNLFYKILFLYKFWVGCCKFGFKVSKRAHMTRKLVLTKIDFRYQIKKVQDFMLISNRWKNLRTNCSLKMLTTGTYWSIEKWEFSVNVSVWQMYLPNEFFLGVIFSNYFNRFYISVKCYFLHS